MNESKLIKIRIPLVVDPVQGGPAGESVWAEVVGENQAKIQNNPIFVTHVNYDDIVEYKLVDDRPEFVRVVTPSGRRNILASYSYKPETIESEFKFIFENLQAWGIVPEGYEEGLIGLSVPKNMHDDTLSAVMKSLGLTEVEEEDTEYLN